MLTTNCDIRMILGGSYSSEVCDIRSAARFFEVSDAQNKRTGFRLEFVPRAPILIVGLSMAE